VKSEHHLLEEQLLGDCSWHFDSINVAYFKVWVAVQKEQKEISE